MGFSLFLNFQFEISFNEKNVRSFHLLLVIVQDQYSHGEIRVRFCPVVTIDMVNLVQ